MDCNPDCNPDCKHFGKRVDEHPCRHCKRICACTDYYEVER